jgi:hypothetical protein
MTRHFQSSEESGPERFQEDTQSEILAVLGVFSCHAYEQGVVGVKVIHVFWGDEFMFCEYGEWSGPSRQDIIGKLDDALSVPFREVCN